MEKWKLWQIWQLGYLRIRVARHTWRDYKKQVQISYIKNISANFLGFYQK